MYFTTGSSYKLVCKPIGENYWKEMCNSFVINTEKLTKLCSLILVQGGSTFLIVHCILEVITESSEVQLSRLTR